MVDADINILVEHEDAMSESRGLIHPSRSKRCLANSGRRCFSGVLASIALAVIAGLGLDSGAHVWQHGLFNHSDFISAQADSMFVSTCKSKFQLAHVTPASFGMDDTAVQDLRNCFYCDMNFPEDVNEKCDTVDTLADQVFNAIPAAQDTQTWSLWTGGSVVAFYLNGRTVTLEATNMAKLLTAMAPSSLAGNEPVGSTWWWDCSKTVWDRLNARYAAALCKKTKEVHVWISVNTLRDLPDSPLYATDIPRLAAKQFCETQPILKVHFLRCNENAWDCHEKCGKTVVSIQNNGDAQEMRDDLTEAINTNKKTNCM